MITLPQPPRAKENANGPIDGYIVVYQRTKLGGRVLQNVPKFEKEVEKGDNANFNLSGLFPWSTYRIQIAAFNLEKKRKTKQKGKKLISKFSDPFTVLTRVAGKTFRHLERSSINCNSLSKYFLSFSINRLFIDKSPIE